MDGQEADPGPAQAPAAAAPWLARPRLTLAFGLVGVLAMLLGLVVMMFAPVFRLTHDQAMEVAASMREFAIVSAVIAGLIGAASAGSLLTALRARPS